MKPFYALNIVFLLSAPLASAQPTLTAATTMPTVGFYDKVYNGYSFTPGTAGANQVWDFSGVTFNTNAQASYQPCNATNGCSSHPGATIAHVYLSLFTYYKASGNTLSMHGFFNGGSAVYYTDPEDYLRFPFNYGKSFVDSFAGSYSSTGGTWYRKGVDSVSADGWGSLKTPAGTFPNTLRIKMVSNYSDTGIISGLPDKIRYKSTTYYYYDAAHKDFLYTTASFTMTPKTGSPQTTSYSRYSINQSVGVETFAGTGLHCQVAPNPARDRVQMTINLEASSRVVVSLSDVTGRVVSSLSAVDLNAGENKISLPAEGLPGGIYVLRIRAGDAVEAIQVAIQ